MKSKYDVIVVGGRVAGTSLAIQLARLGMDVVIFDRARLPGDTMSTHVIYPNTIARLDKLGALDRVMAHRPPPLYTAWYHQNRMFVAPHTPEGGRDWALCIRRSTLDRHLQDCAREAGVDIVSPGSRVRSKITTSIPNLANWMARLVPATRPPTTTTSYFDLITASSCL